MQKILLNDLLHLDEKTQDKTRIKFNIPTEDNDPLELYKDNPDKINVDWFLWHKERRYFPHVGTLAICLVRLYGDVWLLTSIKTITKLLDVMDGIGYLADVENKYSKYFGRVKVKYHNSALGMGKKFTSIADELEVIEILNDKFTGEDFPGYENVRLSYRQLKNIINRKLPGWIPALANQKAVYLITDKKTGKLYVGSATAQWGMLLQRWSDYVANGHGGNKELVELVQAEGIDYVQKYFQYSILENYNARMDDNYVFERENWWKETLLSKKWGYNSN